MPDSSTTGYVEQREYVLNNEIIGWRFDDRASGLSLLPLYRARILYMWRDITNYLRALWKHWVVLAGGVGSLVLAAISTHYTSALPGWTFWFMALACFFIASFCAWRSGQTALLSANAEVQRICAEIERLCTPKYSLGQLKLVRELYEKQDKNIKDLVREIRVRGFMLESQATVFYRTRGFSQSGILNALEYNTSLICKLSGDQYQINPAMQDALYKILDESSPPSQG